MKKLMVALLIVVCMLGLTACGDGGLAEALKSQDTTDDASSQYPGDEIVIIPTNTDLDEILAEAQTLTFFASGADMPNTIVLEKSGDGIVMNVSFMGSSEVYPYHVAVEKVTPKDLEVYREVGTGFYQSERLLTVAAAPGQVYPDGLLTQLPDYPMYLVRNYEGTLSLVTHNFAGNADPDQAHVLVEYMQSPE